MPQQDDTAERGLVMVRERGRGNFVCVCVSVCERSAGWVWMRGCVEKGGKTSSLSGWARLISAGMHDYVTLH